MVSLHDSASSTKIPFVQATEKASAHHQLETVKFLICRWHTFLRWCGLRRCRKNFQTIRLVSDSCRVALSGCSPACVSTMFAADPLLLQTAWHV